MKSSASNPTVLVPLANGSEELESVTIIDTLVRGGAQVTVASVSSQSLQLTCSRGVKIVADTLIVDCIGKRWDMIVCSGGMPGAQHLQENESVQELLTMQMLEGRLIGAICAAPAVVLAAGNYGNCKDKRRMTCYPAEKFTSMIPNYSNDAVVVDGNVITSQGPGTAMEFSLKLVELLFGEDKAEQVRKEMVA